MRRLPPQAENRTARNRAWQETVWYSRARWAAVVDRLGNVCGVAFSGSKVTDKWLGSRAIAVEKAVSFGLDTFAISTANLWAQAQPGASCMAPYQQPACCNRCACRSCATQGRLLPADVPSSVLGNVRRLVASLVASNAVLTAS